jgi:hypothetical protein
MLLAWSGCYYICATQKNVLTAKRIFAMSVLLHCGKGAVIARLVGARADFFMIFNGE